MTIKCKYCQYYENCKEYHCSCTKSIIKYEDYYCNKFIPNYDKIPDNLIDKILEEYLEISTI